MSKKSIFIVLVALQVAFLSLFALSYYATEWIGEEIRLQTAPVDPRDLLYGDYVILNYEISTFSRDLWKGSKPPKDGDTVYVELKLLEDTHSVVGAYPSKPSSRAEHIVLKGISRSSWNMEQISVDYGLERYYVPEGTGLELEEAAGEFIVVAKVAPWGQFKISYLEFQD